MPQVARSPSLVELLNEASAAVPSLSLVMGGARVAEEDELTPVVSEVRLSSSILNVMAALPADLRSVFRATKASDHVKLEHNAPFASAGERREHLHDAERALLRACFCVWPERETLEVSPADAPHFIESKPYEWKPEDESEVG